MNYENSSIATALRLKKLTDIGKNIFSKYPYTEYANELRIDDEVYALFAYVSETRKLVNESVDIIVDFSKILDLFLREFKNELKETVVKTLKEWQESGYLNIIINEALQTQIDEVEKEAKEAIEKLEINSIYYRGKNDGSDESVAINILLAEGRPVKFIGIIGISKPILIQEHGTFLIGDSTGWYNNNKNSTRFIANDDFEGEALVLFRREEGESLRAVGASYIQIDGRVNSKSHGLIGDKLYDSCIFTNITVDNIDNTKSGYIFTANGYPRIGVSQTITATNLLGHHREDTIVSGQAPTFVARGLQECVFVNNKMFAGASAVIGNKADCFLLEDLTGTTFLNASAAFTQGIGFNIKHYNKGANVHIINPTIESVKTLVNVENQSVRLFGTFDTVPATGSVINQGVNSAIVYGATTAGVYVQEMAGVFSTGDVFQNGAKIGVATTVADDSFDGIKIDNPRIFGATSLLPNIVNVQGTERFEMEFPPNSPDSANPCRYTVNIGRRAKGTIIKQTHAFDLNDDGQFTRIDLANNVDYYKMNAFGAYNLPKARTGMKTIYYRTTTQPVNIVPAYGEKFRHLEKGVAFDVGSHTSVSVACIETGIWEIVSVF